LTATDRATALLDLHKELGAKLTNFGGWDMPLQYEGIVGEHNAVRNSVGVFDVSHLGKLRLTGPDAAGVLDRAMTADVTALDVGKASYSLVLTEDGGCIDDVFVYRMDHEDWLVVPNAANVAAVTAAIEEAGGDPVDEWNRYSILAIQGPDSFELFEKAFPNSGATQLKLHHWAPMDVFGERGFVARTGYTGERGFELYAPVETSAEAFRKLLDLGAAPVGLGARDTLRLEMGYALYGHEISLDINPLEAGLGWTLAWDTPFRGREALEKVKAEGAARKLFGIVLTDRGVPRQDYLVFDRAGAEIGRVTSGNYSPSLGTGIALALGPRELAPAEGSPVQIEARGRRIPGDIVKPPFRKRDAA
jgi:aminomethyltransferase